MVLLTEVSAEVEPLSSGTPLVADDTPVWARLDAELLVAARELVQSAVFVVLNVIQQLLETTVSAHHRALEMHEEIFHFEILKNFVEILKYFKTASLKYFMIFLIFIIK